MSNGNGNGLSMKALLIYLPAMLVVFSVAWWVIGLHGRLTLLEAMNEERFKVMSERVKDIKDLGDRMADALHRADTPVLDNLTEKYKAGTLTHDERDRLKGMLQVMMREDPRHGRPDLTTEANVLDWVLEQDVLYRKAVPDIPQEGAG